MRTSCGHSCRTRARRTIDQQHSTADEARLGAGEKHGRGCDIVRAAVATQWRQRPVRMGHRRDRGRVPGRCDACRAQSRPDRRRSIRTRDAAPSSANIFAIITTAALHTESAPIGGSPRSPASDAMWTIEPLVDERLERGARIQEAAGTLIAITRSNAAVGVSISLSASATPALLTSRSRRPLLARPPTDRLEQRARQRRRPQGTGRGSGRRAASAPARALSRPVKYDPGALREESLGDAPADPGGAAGDKGDLARRVAAPTAAHSGGSSL